MKWISEIDYDRYEGENIPPEEFDKLVLRAQEAVDAASGWRIGGMWENGLDEADRRQIRIAVCAQAEYLMLHGAESALDGSAHGGYSIGKTQISGTAAVLRRGGLCAKAVHALAPTGLLYTGVRLK